MASANSTPLRIIVYRFLLVREKVGETSFAFGCSNCQKCVEKKNRKELENLFRAQVIGSEEEVASKRTIVNGSTGFHFSLYHRAELNL